MKTILIVEDEVKLRDELKVYLENNGYNVKALTNFNNPIEDILKLKIDLILLDIKLPNIDGEFICKELRKQINVPIIMVTSKNSEIDELLSINYGADDYITKPYNIQILLARINRLLNRNNHIESINYQDVIIDISKSCLIKNDLVVDLSKNELKILYFLIINQGNILSRDQIISYLWDNNEFVDDNTLTVNINRLRNKLEEIGLKNTIITKRGQGYIIL